MDIDFAAQPLRLNPIGNFIDNLETHILKHRQHIGQRQRIVAVVKLEAHFVTGGALRAIEFHLAVQSPVQGRTAALSTLFLTRVVDQ